jgi:hypothetical protein
MSCDIQSPAKGEIEGIYSCTATFQHFIQHNTFLVGSHPSRYIEQAITLGIKYMAYVLPVKPLAYTGCNCILESTYMGSASLAKFVTGFSTLIIKEQSP